MILCIFKIGIKLSRKNSTVRHETYNLCLAVALCSEYYLFSGMTIRPSFHGRSVPILMIFSSEKSGYSVQEPMAGLYLMRRLSCLPGRTGLMTRACRSICRVGSVQPVMPPDSLARHLEVYGVLVLMVRLGHAQDSDMAAHGVEHGEVGEQLHTDEVWLLGMEADGTQGILEFPEAGLDIPAHVVKLLHAPDGELEQVQVCDQDFPLFLPESSSLMRNFTTRHFTSQNCPKSHLFLFCIQKISSAVLCYNKRKKGVIILITYGYRMKLANGPIIREEDRKPFTDCLQFMVNTELGPDIGTDSTMRFLVESAVPGYDKNGRITDVTIHADMPMSKEFHDRAGEMIADAADQAWYQISKDMSVEITAQGDLQVLGMEGEIPAKLYHITDRAGADSILKEGLLPKREKTVTGMMKTLYILPIWSSSRCGWEFLRIRMIWYCWKLIRRV